MTEATPKDQTPAPEGAQIGGKPSGPGPGKPAEPKKELTWEEKVEKSNKTMHFFPSQLNEKAKEFYEKVKAVEILEDELNNFAANLWFEVRKDFREKNIDLPENCQMGLSLEAAKDGKYIINFRPKTGGMPL